MEGSSLQRRGPATVNDRLPRFARVLGTSHVAIDLAEVYRAIMLGEIHKCAMSGTGAL